jgi:DNA-binding IclR family transcriptional regulator
METSLARALGLFTAVREAGEARADELAAAAGLPLSTAYRYLHDLRVAGLVGEDRGRYSASGGLGGGLRALARPTLERLAEETGETALVAIRQGDHALCLDQVESRHATRMAFRVGQRLPLHAGAASRVLLAYAPADVLADVLAHLDAITPATPDAVALPRRLATIRATGLVTSRSELVPGAIAIATPILVGGACACSLCLAGPDRRGGAAWQRRAKDLLTDARGDLEALLAA